MSLSSRQVHFLPNVRQSVGFIPLESSKRVQRDRTVDAARRAHLTIASAMQSVSACYESWSLGWIDDVRVSANTVVTRPVVL